MNMKKRFKKFHGFSLERLDELEQYAYKKINNQSGGSIDKVSGHIDYQQIINNIQDYRLYKKKMLDEEKRFEGLAKVQPERLDQMEQEALHMLHKFRLNTVMKKVYSDVDFCWIIDEIRAYRLYLEDLERAEELFH